MGQVFLNCRSKNHDKEYDDEYQEKLIENQIYLPGSLDYLELIGMDRVGHFIPDQERL